MFCRVLQGIGQLKNLCAFLFTFAVKKMHHRVPEKK